MRLPCAATLALFVAASAQQPAAPPPPPTQAPGTTFRTAVDLIQLDVIVLDRNRRPVTDLTARDFTLQPNGKPAAIDAFAAITLPEPVRTEGGAAWTRDVPPDVVTNQNRDEGRLVVIMMDRTIPAGRATLTARAIGRAAVDALGPMDLAAVVQTSGFAKEGVAQGFTADKARLRAAIDAPLIGQTALQDMRPEGLHYLPPEQAKTGDCPDGTCGLEAMRRVAEAMTGVTGRQKTILFVGAEVNTPDSQGIDLMHLMPTLKEAFEKTLSALDRANVTLHAIDPTGLETLAAGFTPTGKATAPYSQAANLKRQGNLAVLPAYTGGRTVVNTNAPQDSVPRIFEETRAYYLFGVRLADANAKAASSGEIRVRVNRDDVIVLSRRGYHAASASPVERPPGEALERAIAPLLPASALPLQIGLLPIYQRSGDPAVNLLLRIGAAMESHGTRVLQLAGPFDALVVVFDMEGRKVASVRQSIDAPAAIDSAGFEWMSYFPLKPGRYEVRVAIRPKATATASSVYGYIEMPEVKPGLLAMSGIRLESPLGPGRLQPTLRRRFAAEDRIDAFVQVRRAVKDPSPVSVRVELVDDRDIVVVRRTTSIDEDAFSGDVAGYRYPLPLAELRPGRYLLRVEAAQATTASRAVPFVVGNR